MRPMLLVANVSAAFVLIIGIRALGLEALRLGGLPRLLRAAAPMLLVSLTQHSIEGRLRGHLLAFMRPSAAGNLSRLTLSGP